VFVTKLIRAALGAGAQAGDALADSQAFHTLEWELRSVDGALAAALKDLTAVMALEMAEHRRIQALAQRIEADEAVAQKALAANEEALALELAERIAEMRAERDGRAADRVEHAARVRQMRASIAAMGKRVGELRREFAVQRARAALSRVESVAVGGSSAVAASLSEAEATLERIKQRKQEHADRLAAAAELSDARRGEALNGRLRQAGLIAETRPTAASVLAELRARGKAPDAPAPRTSVPSSTINPREV
jgi:phage shock protein A